MPFLSDPADLYRESYLNYLRAMQAEGRRRECDRTRVAADFAGFVRELRSQADRRKVKFGRVPANTFWLIEDDQVIGQSSLRHQLNHWLRKYGGHIGYEICPTHRRRGCGTEILRLTLVKARELGLARVLITCDEDNYGSKRIIEKNGGVFENAVPLAGQRAKKLRYWIELKE